jgi:hypothetical protein
MTIWKHSTMENYYASGDEKIDLHCEVRIDGEKIVVSYDDDDGPSVYEGSQTAPGHFSLALPRKKGRATLHRAPDSDFLEGHWIEAGYQGMWRIQLSEEE